MKCSQKDWYYYYLQRHLSFDLDEERAFVEFVSSKLKPGSRILECGAGLGRSAAGLASLGGFAVLAVDINPSILGLAADLNHDLSRAGKLAFANIDIRYLSRFFHKSSFDACSHAGVLEHFSKEERVHLLREQLSVSRYVFASIPLNTDHNRGYFHPNSNTIRDLKNLAEWAQEFSEKFRCVAATEERQRTDNGFFLIERA